MVPGAGRPRGVDAEDGGKAHAMGYHVTLAGESAKDLAMAKVKGVLLNGWMRFLKKRFGEAAVTTAIEGCSPEERRSLTRVFLPSSWYPFESLHLLRRLTRSLAGPTDLTLGFEIGRAMARHLFTGVYHTLLTHEPSAQVQQFRTTAEFCYQESVRLEATMLDSSSCVVRYRYDEGASANRAICESIAGFWTETLEMSGALNVESAHPECLARGGRQCEYSFKWRP